MQEILDEKRVDLIQNVTHNLNTMACAVIHKMGYLVK